MGSVIDLAHVLAGTLVLIIVALFAAMIVAGNLDH
jgi:hypothetical protein